MPEEQSPEWKQKRRKRWKHNLFHTESLVEEDLVERQKKYTEELFEYLQSLDLGVTAITIIGSTFRGYAKTTRKNDIDIIVFHKGGKFVNSYAEMAKHVDQFEQDKLEAGEETFMIHFVNEISEKDIQSAAEDIRKDEEFRSGNDRAIALHLLMPSISEDMEQEGEHHRIIEDYRGYIADALDSLSESRKWEWMRLLLEKADREVIDPSIQNVLDRGMISEDELGDYIADTKKLIKRRASLLFDRKHQQIL